MLFLLGNVAFSQNYHSKNYNATNELPNNAVRSLFVDSNSILWIGTENGLVKKENDVFTSFYEEDGLALNSCWAITEDNNKKMWFGSYGGGLSIYDGNKFTVISQKDGLANNEITKLFTNGNYMFVGTSNGVSVIDIHTLKVVSVKQYATKEPFRVHNFFEYKNQIYATTYNSGIFKIIDKNNQIALVKMNNHKYIYSNLVDKDSIYSSNKGFFTKSLVRDYVSKKDSIPLKKYGKSIIWDYVKSNDKKIFVAAWGIYDNNGGIYEVVNNQLISRAADFNIIGKNVISLAYDAAFEKLYVGTKDAGLFEVNLKSQVKFNRIQGANVIGFAKTQNTAAMLLNDAIFLTNSKKQQKITTQHFKKWQEAYVLKTKIPLPKHEDYFYELDYASKANEVKFYDIKASNNIFWVNTNIGLFAIIESGMLLRYLPLHSEEINFTDTGALIETNPYHGLRVYNDLEKFNYTYFKEEDANTPTMVVNSFQKANKTYFLSVFSGLFVWQNNGFKSYLHQGIWKEKKLKHISPLDENMAISNEFGDVFIVNDEASFNLLKKIPRAKIQGNSISFLKEYKGTLLIGTEKGLTLFKNNRFIFLDEEQGLKQPLLSADVFENNLAIGSENGYYTLNLEVLTNPKALVNLVKLKEIFTNNNKFPSDQFADKVKITLAHNENTILLKFSTNAHPYPHKLSYQYRLNVNDNWSIPSLNPEIFLPFLQPKNYDVEVKVLDQSTGLSYSQSLLKLAILPPFWKTWWFVLLLMSAIFIVVFSIYKFQIRQTKNFEEQKGLFQKRFEETKMEALLAQMNPHFIFNAMNSIQNFIMDSDIDNATLFLGDFAKLIRLNLDQCTKPTILLIEEIEYLQSYIRVENTRFNNKILVHFEVDPLIDVYDVKIPSMLLQSFIENVFVHAFPPSITNPTLKVGFKSLSENVLQCKIEDNGIGLTHNSSNSLHQSKGITLVKERLTLLGYNVDKAVQIISAKNKGTSIIIQGKRTSKN